MSAYEAGYEFDAKAVVNGELATSIRGRLLGGASLLVIESGDGVVEYLTTPDGRWARIPGGVWEELEGSAPVGNPLAVLAAPTTLDLVSVDGGRVVLSAVYPADVLQVSGGDVAVTLAFDDGSLVEASYNVVADGNTASTSTVFRPLADMTPITAPTG